MTKFLSGESARVTIVAMGSAAIMAVGASAASATTVLGGGGALGFGTSVGAPLSGTATFTGPAGNMACAAGNLAGTIGSNPSASVSFTPTALNLNTCTDSIAAFNLLSASLSVPGTGSVTYGAINGTLKIVNPVVLTRWRTSSGAPMTCPFTINNTSNTASATTNNADNSVSFINVPVASNSGICASMTPASFSGRFKPLTAGGALVTLAP